jgi:ABC-type transporter Mla MlaB component
MTSHRPKIATEPLPLRRGERGAPLAPIDRAWLRMDEPANRMHVHGVLVLDGDVSRETVAEILGERFARIPRFRQRVADDLGGEVWVDDAEFDIARHVVEQQLHAPGSDRILATAIERHLHEGFDRAHPLWTFHVLRGYQHDKTAVLARIHHTIGDGVALMMVLLAMTDQAAAAGSHSGGGAGPRIATPPEPVPRDPRRRPRRAQGGASRRRAVGPRDAAADARLGGGVRPARSGGAHASAAPWR